MKKHSHSNCFFLKSQISNLKLPNSPQKGISMVEFLIVMGLFAVVTSLTVYSLLNSKHGASLSSATNVLIGDLKEQQIKAMVGDTEGNGTIESYGIHFSASSYTLFRKTYLATSSANFVVNLSDTVRISSTLPSAEILFTKGTGEVSNYSATQSAITVSDSTNTSTKTLTINRYGAITGIN